MGDAYKRFHSLSLSLYLSLVLELQCDHKNITPNSLKTSQKFARSSSILNHSNISLFKKEDIMLNAWYLVLGRAHSYTEVVRAVIFSVGMYTYTLSGWCSCLLKGSVIEIG